MSVADRCSSVFYWHSQNIFLYLLCLPHAVCVEQERLSEGKSEVARTPARRCQLQPKMKLTREVAAAQYLGKVSILSSTQRTLAWSKWIHSAVHAPAMSK